MPSVRYENTAWSNITNRNSEQGVIARRKRKTSMRDIELLTENTDDNNPIHYDGVSESVTLFGGLMVQGDINSGLLNASVAEDLPGPGTVFLEVE